MSEKTRHTPMKVRTSYTGCPYVTAGKEYEAVKLPDVTGYSIVDDQGDTIRVMYSSERACPHLNWSGTWEIVADQPDIAAELAEALEHIAEYWNGDPNDQAMLNALDHILDTANAALAKYRSMNP